MIKVTKQNCDDCIHTEVCKNKELLNKVHETLKQNKLSGEQEKLYLQLNCEHYEHKLIKSIKTSPYKVDCGF